MLLKVLVSPQTNPHRNVAVENYLVSRPSEDDVTLYLWKNRRTVVIGQNQNPFAECNVDLLLADGGYLMRRTTGGGAVYHDDGNINFSFVAPPNLYNQDKHFEVISLALSNFGIKVEKSGRNDLLSDGRKFSGNAFSKGRNHWLHHGTLLIRGNVDDLSRYLRVKPAKLHKHGVASVKSRVVNLSELSPTITSDNIAPLLVEALEKVYGMPSKTLDFNNIASCHEVEQLYYKYSSDDWLFGHWRNFKAIKSQQFDWGYAELSLSVDESSHTITDAILATDALDVELCDKTRTLLVGASTLRRPDSSDNMLNDILSMVY